MVELDILFAKGGGVGGVFPVAADGSWTVTWTPGISPGTVLPNGRHIVQAECLDVTFTGFVLAEYRSHTIKVNT